MMIVLWLKNLICCEIFFFSFLNLEVYPKVKVRQQHDQDDHQQHVLPDFSSADEHEDTHVTSIAKVPKSYIPNIGISCTDDMPRVAMPKISVVKEAEEDNKKVGDEDGKQNIRACSIPRPRAVLSSPDNDLVIGNQNRSKTERPSSVLKNHKLPQNRHSQCKVISKTPENSVNTQKSKEDQDESHLKGRKGSIIAGPTKRPQIRTGKPAPTRT